MKSPADQKIIQIDITNACTHRCSNCTRFCGHHRKPFFMDFETFAGALASLDGYGGMVGVMGGEPTIHPEFARLVGYYRDRVDGGRTCDHGRLPLREFTEHAEENLAFDATKRRGLWTSLGEKYYEHFELIQETFPYQCINDHRNPGLHQALLVSRRDLGITDAEWIPLRDNCWIQNLWSSCITPKGAFFCEVAGALDMLFDGPGGWPVEAGWWRRTPAEFGEQLNWCELCGAALQVPRRRANEEIDDISPALAEKLKAVGSPKLRKGRVRVLDVGGYRPEDFQCRPSNEWYLPEEDNSERVAGTNRSLYPRTIDAIVVARAADRVAALVREAERQFDRVVACGPWLATGGETTEDTKSTERARGEAEQGGTTKCAKDAKGEGGVCGRNAVVREAMRLLRPQDWVVVLDEDVVLEAGFADRLRGWILNPGCVYEYTRHRSRAPGGSPLIRTDSNLGAGDLRDGNAFCSVFNVRARSIRTALAGVLDRGEGTIAPSLWPDDKRIDMHAFLMQPDPLAERRRLGRAFARQALAVWQALTACGRRIALFGAGHHTRWLLAWVRSAGMALPVVIFDDNPYTYDLDGVAVKRPEGADAAVFDAVVVSADPGRMTGILACRCRQLWGEDAHVVTLYHGFPEGRFMKVPPRGSGFAEAP